jgi:pilus assembly protein Flp/PilA
MKTTIRQILVASSNDRRGVTALEYGLLATFVALALIASIHTYATDLATVFTVAGGTL